MRIKVVMLSPAYRTKREALLFAEAELKHGCRYTPLVQVRAHSNGRKLFTVCRKFYSDRDRPLEIFDKKTKSFKDKNIVVAEDGLLYTVQKFKDKFSFQSEGTNNLIRKSLK